MMITPIAALNDNYIWCLHRDNAAWVVDPGSADAVLAHLEQQQLQLRGILITHHHWDHTDGIETLRNAFAAIPVIGPDNPVIQGLTQRVQHGQQVELDGLGVTAKVIALPGHTLDHLGYCVDNAVFCGDTLFSGGCGRLFEGTAAQMHNSLSQLAALPADTRVFCTHEYTLANLAFASAVEPDNEALLEYRRWCEAQRAAGQPTLPSTIGQERAINPFLRVDTAGVKAALSQREGTESDSVARFAALRHWKDNF
ncbi:hydroxyacylglutathione hydrolase [Ferrimonas balearica]|uniref:hydroxyacylglutathione hydrolase n=1 Tax=Ferrimonas balearica TaxID=44012 RepID=UPI001F31BB46|nr:hydroxyacylglutathione hydrolase [Ferrimonas balearica]MBY6093295.1 hydroxyacylglutathione hydrolase [Ferrimonas balearica]